MEEIMNDKWISIDEAAEYLGIKTVTLRSWIRNGKEGLPAQKLLRLFQRVQNNPFQLSTEQYVPTGLPGVDTYRTTATCPGKQDWI